ncbi:calcium-translocating P-type ATPase, PMCA-type [Romboutsia sedimentorum]|uniref:P-type Ca(2+) transporter n=1 Tax=Romboutsia sedimentorum TaxID=1368474 RepID=A0ABT7E8W9_9FIRM|nr:calcium-translocating P-type ATPase, PMCA-type [Romboutsia sedimentorum]MDK2563369.1 calcium-translocating P-type ATPase, PMCA-type [Romboutsia sedimentorum]MDK2585093.1 calcium-translocating P-type ATPase, PMCA-type [Romboutsia sedimentorum]
MYYKQRYIESVKRLNSNINGLESDQIQKRLDEFGYNELKEGKKVPMWKLFLESFKDPLVIILLIAAIVQVFLGEMVESIIIFIVIILNSILGVTQTKKAEGSLESLKKLSSPKAKVLRNNEKVSISARELVPGDVVLLEAGDYIPADGRIIEAQSLKIVEGMLTGESEPVLKHNEKIDEDVGIGDQKNMVFSGSLVVYGRGSFIVTSTGMNTEMGKVAGLLESAENKQTPLQEKLDQFGKKLGIAIVIIAILIFIIQVARGFISGGNIDRGSVIIDSFMFAIAVAVAAIPEALSSIVTIVLSVGTNDMAKKQAIIRKLPAVETLGSTSVICTDKTGTLTQNKMTVVDFYMYETKKEDMEPSNINYSYHSKTLTVASAICNDSNINQEGKELGDPTEVALIKFANNKSLDYQKLREKYDRLSEIPFDSDRKLMSTVNDIYGNAYMFTKGAPDVVLSRCKYALVDGVETKISDEIINAYKEMNENFSKKALRVLAFAFKDVPDEDFVPALEDEVDMTLVGLMAMIDPPRDEVFDAVKDAKSAGIKTVMITGDHKTTAAAIAKEIGIMDEEDIALTGQELDDLSEDELNEKLEHISVYARVSPENKIRIVKAWQDKGKITAMTGDGVNDAPALKQANIGIGMGSGTDVAKDASAMILVDDNFATIVSAVEVGRTVYNNIKKSITYLFAGNFAGIVTILFAVFANWANPFTTLQLLFINLITDSLPAIALGFEKPEKNVMSKKPRDPNESILAGGTIKSVAFRGMTIAIVVIIAQYIGMQTSPQVGTAMAFSTITLARILQTLPARSNEYNLIKLGFFSNMYVIYAIISCILIYGLTLLPLARGIFSIPLDFGFEQLGICIGLALLSTVIMELVKFRHKNEI